VSGRLLPLLLLPLLLLLLLLLLPAVTWHACARGGHRAPGGRGGGR
jgi:hypothetical protein